MNRKRAEKELKKLRKPGGNKNCRYDKMAAILEAFGFICDDPGSGSHRLFKHPRGTRAQLVDRGSGTLLPVYVDDAIEAIERAEEGK